MGETRELEKPPLLRAGGWLAGQPPALRAALLARAEPRRFAAGQVAFRPDDPPGGVFGIVSGAFTLAVAVPPAPLTLAHVMRAGAWFGQGPMLLGGRRQLELRAVEPSEALHLPLATLDAIAAEHPLAHRALGQIGETAARVAAHIVSDLLIARPERRLAAVLLRVTGAADGAPPPPEWVARLGQAELAEMANVSRQLANRALGGFARRGWVALGYQRVAVLDAAALAAFAHPAEG